MPRTAIDHARIREEQLAWVNEPVLALWLP